MSSKNQIMINFKSDAAEFLSTEEGLKKEFISFGQITKISPHKKEKYAIIVIKECLIFLTLFKSYASEESARNAEKAFWKEIDMKSKYRGVEVVRPKRPDRSRFFCLFLHHLR